MSRLADLGREYYEVDNAIKELNDRVDELKHKREELLNELVTEMQQEDLPEFSVEGIGKRFALKTEQYASYLVADKYEVFDAFRQLGYDGIIKEDIHAKTLNSTIKELTENGTKELPLELQPYIKIFEKPKISITKR